MSFVSLPICHTSIIHKKGGGGKQTEEWGNMCTRQQKAPTLAITSPLMHFTSGHANTHRPNRKRKSNSNTLFQVESTYVYPQKSAHPESTEWSYEHLILEHKHFIPTAHVISRSWSWRTAGIMGSGLALAISIFPFAGSEAMPLIEHGDRTTSEVEIYKCASNHTESYLASGQSCTRILSKFKCNRYIMWAELML